MIWPYSTRQSMIRGLVLAAVAGLIALPTLCRAAADAAPAPEADTVDYSALTRELTLTRNSDGRITMAMWLPEDFWRISFKNSGKLTGKGVADYLAVIHPYILVAVTDAQRGITAFRFTDIDTLTGEVTIEDAHGKTYSPLAPDSVSEEMRNLVQTMRPLMSNLMGALGQHLEFLVFPSADGTGHPIADPKSDGSMTVHIGDLALRYRLPLGSLLPPSLDPKTRESFPGSYHFNPYTGGKLVPQPSGARPEPAAKPQ